MSYKSGTALKSRNSDFTVELDFLIKNKIANNLPATRVDISKWKILKSIDLADPFFNIPGKIDLLIGSEIYFKLMLVKYV